MGRTWVQLDSAHNEEAQTSHKDVVVPPRRAGAHFTSERGGAAATFLLFDHSFAESGTPFTFSSLKCDSVKCRVIIERDSGVFLEQIPGPVTQQGALLS